MIHPFARILPLLLLAVIPGTGPSEPASTRPAPGDTLILTRASILPMTGEGVLHDRTIVVADGEIVAVRSGWEPPATEDTEIRDLRGSYVLPGLIDAHVHLREPDPSLVLFPAAGVTTVVNLEGEPRHLRLADSVITRGLVAPRIISSGPFLDEVAQTPSQVRREVRRQVRDGYDLIKIHGEMEEESFLAAIDEAAQAELPVVGHRPDNLDVELVLGGGMSALAHVEEVLGSSLLSEPAGLSADSARKVGTAIARSGTAVITTLSFFTGMRDQATDAFYELINQPELAYVSPERRRAWLYDGHREYIEQSELLWYEDAVADLHAIAGATHEAGGTLVAGTDTPLEFTIPGFSLRRELRHLVDAGLSPREALRAATAAPAELLGRPELGRVRVGAIADLLVVPSDPGVALEALDGLEAVVLRGRWLPRDSLEQRRHLLAATYARAEVRRAGRERVREELVRLIPERGLEAAVEVIRGLSDDPDTPSVGEVDLNALGYALLSSGDVETAIAIFRLNAELHPESANVHDSLGEAYLEAGRLEEARRSYERALALDPTMDSSRRGLREIDARKEPEGAD